MDRRKFLEMLTLGMFTVVTGEACTSSLRGMSYEELDNLLPRPEGRDEDPHEYTKLLQEGEYVIPDEVFDIYSQTIDPRINEYNPALGGYIDKNRLNSPEKRKTFQQRMRGIGKTEEEIEKYFRLFETTNIILFRKKVLQSERFPELLDHERVHQIITNLPVEVQRQMRDVANKMLEMRENGAEDREVLREKGRDKIGRGGLFRASVESNWQEFYTYLLQGKWSEITVNVFRDNFPQEYARVQEIQNELIDKKQQKNSK